MNSAVASRNYQSDDISVSEPASATSDCSGNSEDDSLNRAQFSEAADGAAPDAKPASLERKLQSSATSMADSARTQATAGSSVSGFSPGDSGAEDRAKKAAARTTFKRERHPVAPKRAPDVASTPTPVDSATDRAVLDRASREAAKNTDYSDSDNARVGAYTEQSAQEDLEAGAGVMKQEQQSEEEVQSECPSPPAMAAGSSVPDEENQEASLPVVDSSASPPMGQPPIEIREPAPSQGSSPLPEESPRPNADPSRELPEAIPVPEPLALRPATSVAPQDSSVGDSHVVQAQPLDSWDEDKEGRSKPAGAQWLSSTQWAVGALLIAVLIVVGVVVGITQTKDGGGGGGDVVVDQADNSTSAPSQEDDAFTIAPETIPPSYATFPPFSSTLHFLTQEALEDPASPQSRANAWMMQDPHLVAYSEDRKLQRFALATLYYSTSGHRWDNNEFWLDYEHDECEWYNQDALKEEPVCTANSTILHLKLSDNSLDGVLPVELFSFPALETLDLSRNRLHGTAPTMFSGARNLKRLVLSSNQLTGQFTAELGFVASQLAVLHNDDNQITGSVPGLLRLLPHLHDLNITGNQYTGSLPRNLNQLRDTLTSLEVSDNAITGAIPTELGAASNLQVLDVGGNPQLGGTIPTELATLANLATLDISNTAISGALPGDLCALQQEGQLELVADCGGTFHCCAV